MTPSQLADKLDRIRAAIPKEMAVAQARVGVASVKIARKWSSGGATQAEHNAADNPYATRHGVRGMYPEVNRQSGTFFAGWQYDAAGKRLVNAVPYGGAIQRGTRVMNRRDILGAISRDIRPLMREEVRKAIRRSLRA